jgi:predicted DNA-binding transcriptional regulator YafY
MTAPPTPALDGALLLLEILRRIPRKRYTTSVHLHNQLIAAGFDLSLRTMQRHIDALCSRFPIECDTRSKPFGYRWREGAEGLHLPLLAPAEALTMQLARQEIASLLPARTVKTLAPLFDTARRTLDDSLTPSAARRWLGKVMRLPESQPLLPPRIAPDVFEAVSEALYEERKLDLAYRNARDARKRAIVWPLGLVQQGVRLYLVCRFEGYDNERILALPRIQQARALTETFPWPKGFDLERYCAAGHFGVSQGRRVRLSFLIDEAVGQHLVESPLSMDQMVAVRDGRLAVTATVEETALLHRWLRGWGEAVGEIQMVPVGEPEEQ